MTEMSAFVRIFAKLFMGFPGFLIWIYGCLLAVSGCASLMEGVARREGLACLLMFLGSFVVAQIGHGMWVASGILNDDPKFRLLGHHLGKHIAWGALVQATGILTVAAGLASLISIAEEHWSRLPLALPLFVLFAWVFRRLLRKRRDLHFQWVHEVVTRETERARMEFDALRMQEKLEAPHFLGRER